MKGDNISDSATKDSKSRFINLKKNFTSKKYLIVISALFISLVVGIIFLTNKKDQEPVSISKEEQYAKDLQNSDSSDESKSQIVADYGKDYDSTISKVTNARPNEWNKTMLDEAYKSLLYADKIGAFTQVNTLLSTIDAMQRSGLDIDDNSYSVNQEVRASIKDRANVNQKQPTITEGFPN